ncbi:hypothetical protein D081_0900 [Anaerovibrio sp. JC8]|nr:hypothetical protein D081_0900 [Anaerovibrio sp. JC8]
MGYASIIHEFEENWKEGIEEEEGAEDSDKPEEDAETEEAGEEAPEDEFASPEDGGFTPLQADELRHVATDQEE